MYSKVSIKPKLRLFNVKFHLGYKIVYLNFRFYVKKTFAKSRLYCISHTDKAAFASKNF